MTRLVGAGQMTVEANGGANALDCDGTADPQRQLIIDMPGTAAFVDLS